MRGERLQPWKATPLPTYRTPTKEGISMASFSQLAQDFQAAQRSGDQTLVASTAAALRATPEAAAARQQTEDRVATQRQPRSRS